MVLRSIFFQYLLEHSNSLISYLLELFRDLGVHFFSRQLPYGRFNYEHATNLLRPSLSSRKLINSGMICYTSFDYSGDFPVNRGLFLSLTGQGCWGVDFQQFMASVAFLSPKITRVDMCQEFYIFIKRELKKQAFILVFLIKRGCIGKV